MDVRTTNSLLISPFMLLVILQKAPSGLTARGASNCIRTIVHDPGDAPVSDMTVLTVNGTPGMIPGRIGFDTSCQKYMEDDGNT